MIGLVLFFNVQAAAAFIGAPARYAASFELTGATGEAAVMGMAVLFLMWNVPYAVAEHTPCDGARRSTSPSRCRRSACWARR